MSKSVHSLRIPFEIPVAPGKVLSRIVYCHLIYGEKICLIDSGVAGSERIIFEYIRNTGRDPNDIARLILTHSHPDHIGAARAIKERCGCTVEIHEAERTWIEDIELQNAQRPIPGFHTLVGGSVRIDRVLNDGDIIDLDEHHRIGVFHTPGHSAGSISLLVQPERILISGDAIPLQTDLPIYDDYGESIRSIKKLQTIEDISRLLSAWDEPRSANEAYAIMEQSLMYLARIHDAVKKNVGTDYAMDPMELCRCVVATLGLPPAAAMPHLARSFQANVRALIREGGE